MPDQISPSAQKYLDALPPFEASSNTVQATLHAVALETDRIQEAAQFVRDNQFPATASSMLDVYESYLGLAVNSPSKTVAQRRVTVMAYLRGLRTTGAGSNFKTNLSALIGTNWSYIEHDPNDTSTPVGNVIAIQLPFTPELGVVENLTAVAGDAGTGTLPDQEVVHYGVTALNFFGQTTLGGDVQVTSNANGSTTLTWNPVEGATGYAVYRGPFISQRHLLAADVSDTTYVDFGAETQDVLAPDHNTTASFQASEAYELARRIVPAHIALVFNYGSGFIVGVGQIGVTPL